MLHIPLIQYFECQENVIPELIQLLELISGQTVKEKQEVALISEGISHSFDRTGDIYLDFSSFTKESPAQSPGLHQLYFEIQKALKNQQGITLDKAHTSTAFALKISLMQHADLPLTVFQSAIVFASSVIEELSVPDHTKAWQLVLLRYKSNAAGEDWSQGLWANDLSWNLMASYSI